nr:MAG TPA_asm: hypothetical protein [Caudoviricetes sp.]
MLDVRLFVFYLIKVAWLYVLIGSNLGLTFLD